ncbi:MAG: MFS transporter [Gammaproteobacteria bacterium]|nr:MFS transporter [Gammaproteobacteria bacterium]
MYDFANSGYTTVVITAVFGAYFVGVITGGADWGTFAWTLALSVSYAMVMLTAPLVGAWADAHAAKKRLLVACTVGCVVFTALLYFTGPGSVALAVVLLAVSNYFFGTGENIIAAFLPELADSGAMGRVSGWGWSFGYCGGIVALGVCLAYITWAQGHGVLAEDYVPIAMLITAVIFLLSALPTFLFLRERAKPQPLTENPWKRVRQTLRHAREFSDLRWFLICMLFYQAGIQAVIALAAIYADQVMHFTTAQTIQLILVVNFTAAAGAFAFGYVQDRIGHIPAVAVTLVGWIIMVIIAGTAEGPTPFWVAANIAGLCMGSSQASGRAIVGYLAPPSRVAEFFGLWGLSVKAASIFGPLTYGVVTWLFAGNHRLGMFAVGSYFVIGLLLLTKVDVRRGRANALAEDAAGSVT